MRPNSEVKILIFGSIVEVIKLKEFFLLIAMIGILITLAYQISRLIFNQKPETKVHNSSTSAVITRLRPQ